MDVDDVVAPGDAALQMLLASIAEHANDAGRREKLLGAMITVPPLADWPTGSLEALQMTCQYVMGLGRLSRKLTQLTDLGDE